MIVVVWFKFFHMLDSPCLELPYLVNYIDELVYLFSQLFQVFCQLLKPPKLRVQEHVLYARPGVCYESKEILISLFFHFLMFRRLRWKPQFLSARIPRGFLFTE